MSLACGPIKNTPTTDEVVTEEELTKLFDEKSSPNHYIGLEISGFLHLGSLISTGFKINDFIISFGAKKVAEGFNYDSGTNTEWETIESLRTLIKEHVDSNFE